MSKDKGVKCLQDDDDKQMESIKFNPYGRRCCQILPTEFESLHISGDKMKLEDRSRIEPKPNGVKECKCERRERKEVHGAGQIDSQSRRRRRICKKSPLSERHQHKISKSDVTPKESEMKLDLSEERFPRSSSARERRRQKRLQEIATETCNNPEEQDLEDSNSESNDDRGRMDSDYTGSEEELSSSESPRLDEASGSNMECVNKSKEVEDFVIMLDTTLNDSGSSNCNAVGSNPHNATNESGMDLSCRVVMLEETLVKKIGKVSSNIFITFFFNLA